jgi:hypothetical protein
MTGRLAVWLHGIIVCVLPWEQFWHREIGFERVVTENARLCHQWHNDQFKLITMKPNIIIALGLLTAGSALAADTNLTDQAKSAIIKLKAQTNYSWTAKIELPGMPFTPSPMEGKTQKEGFTMVSQDMNDNTIEVVLKGDKLAVKLQDGWQLVGASAAGAGDAPDFGVMIGQWLARNKTAGDEAESLLKNAKELKSGDAGLLSGDLTEVGAKALLSFGPRGADAANAGPKNAKGSVKFWLKDGELTKFESHVQGTTAFGPDQEERDVDMTRTVEIKDIGTTKVEVPAEAKQKLEAK